MISWPRLLDPEQATEYVGGKLIFNELRKKNFIAPRVQRRGCTRYDRVELDNALDRWAGLKDDDEN